MVDTVTPPLGSPFLQPKTMRECLSVLLLGRASWICIANGVKGAGSEEVQVAPSMDPSTTHPTLWNGKGLSVYSLSMLGPLQGMAAKEQVPWSVSQSFSRLSTTSTLEWERAGCYSLSLPVTQQERGGQQLKNRCQYCRGQCWGPGRWGSQAFLLWQLNPSCCLGALFHQGQLHILTFYQCCS